MKLQSDPAGSQQSLSLRNAGSPRDREETRSGEKDDLSKRMIKHVLWISCPLFLSLFAFYTPAENGITADFGLRGTETKNE